MITTLKSLQNKFVTDPVFGKQFVIDASWLAPQFEDYLEIGTETDKDSQEARRKVIEGLGSNLLSMYYRALKTLLEDNNRRYPLYVRVPFSEDTFKINTESRIITVPKDFQTNGVGVVGDHLAEFLWFEVDRFYDVNDLMNCKIDITWRNLTTVGNLQPTVYDAVPYAKYCDNEKVYFGWYITNNASVAAGTIEFAIRFYNTIQIEQNSVTTEQTAFSLYTQPAKLTIKNGMVFTGMPLSDNFEQIVRTRPIFSEIINSLDAAEPILTESLVRDSYDVDPETGVKIFTITAISPDNAGLNLGPAADNGEGEEEEEGEPNALASDTDGALDEPKAVIEFNWYWNNHLIDDNITAIREVINNGDLILTTEPICEVTTTSNGQIFTSTLRTNVPGDYRAYVGNKIVDLESENYNGVRYVQTSTATLEKASQIKLAQPVDLPEVYYLDMEVNGSPAVLSFDVDFATANGVVKYRWFQKDGVNEPIGLGEDWAVITEENHNVGLIPTERGILFAEVQNTKNSMLTLADTPDVLVMAPPQRINQDDIVLTYNHIENTLRCQINNGYSDNEYAYQVYVFDNNNPIRPVTQKLSLTGEAVYQVGPVRVFDLSPLNLDFSNNKIYTVRVMVSQVTCRGRGAYERYVYDDNGIYYGFNDITIKLLNE